MRKLLIAAAIVLTIPLGTLIYLKLFNGKVVIVRNAGTEAIQISVTIDSGGAIEKTEPRSIAANDFSWIIFFPRTKGLLMLRCASAGNVARLSLGGGGQGGASFSNVTLDGCNRVVSRNAIGF
jgi:hypothetical protein